MRIDVEGQTDLISHFITHHCGDTGMTTIIITHPDYSHHRADYQHPECPERLEAITSRLQQLALPHCRWQQARHAEQHDIERVHSGAHYRRLAAGETAPTPDTYLNDASFNSAMLAAGAAIQGVDALLSGECSRVFCAVRPPGHHAEYDEAMGFCLFNNVAIAANYARAVHGIERVAIVDFDVHHGNGTQHTFESEPQVLFASSHQWPLYPGTGSSDEQGVGNIVNVPLPAGTSSEGFRAAYRQQILPAVDRFEPQLIIVSAGFDAHRDDPLSDLALVEEDYQWVTEELLAVAERHAEGRLLSSLEGGYNLDALAASVASHLQAMG